MKVKKWDGPLVNFFFLFPFQVYDCEEKRTLTKILPGPVLAEVVTTIFWLWKLLWTAWDPSIMEDDVWLRDLLKHKVHCWQVQWVTRIWRTLAESLLYSSLNSRNDECIYFSSSLFRWWTVTAPSMFNNSW